MSSLLGQTLAHYRVTERIGAGGMGEVYRATDTNLGRDVAIKVLPAEVAGDPERLARFRREARLLAALNHPNIAAIYGIEESESGPFLALELVEGEDLKQRLDRGAIPVEEALEIAMRVAEALEEAHAKGIVHRDLKPANVKVAPDGKVKVLDFGLAKAWASDAGGDGSSASALSQSPTLARGGTMAGVVLGTAAYMSPEQARGKAVDKRADVWSFGVLLWEMLTGRALFTGETVTDVIAAVVSREPDLGALPATTPAAVRLLIARCLRKDPRQRLPDIGAARLELQDVIGGAASGASTSAPDQASETPHVDRRRLTRERLAWGAALLVAAVLAAALAIVHLTEVPERPRPVRFATDAPAGWSFADFGWPVPSPDGREIAFVAHPDSPQRGTGAAMLWTRSLESLDARPLVGTEGVEDMPIWSPDGKSIAFFAKGELRRIELAGGTAQRICAKPEACEGCGIGGSGGTGGGDWSRSGTILFSAGGFSGRIYAVAATGGEARPLTTLDPSRGETNHHQPQFLPDGRRFLFAIGGSRADGLYVASLDAPAERQKVASDWAHYVFSTGHLFFAREGTLFAQGFDATRARTAGEPIAIASSVGAWTVSAALGWFGVSEGGTIAFFSGVSGNGQVQLAWLDRKGGGLGSVSAPDRYGQIALSPDGRNVAVEISDVDNRQADLWVIEVARGVTSRVTATPDIEANPVWAPDGRSLAFSVWGHGKAAEVRRKGLRVSDPEMVLVDTPEQDHAESWSADGKTLFFLRRTIGGGTMTAWALPLGGGDPVQVARAAGAKVDEPHLSPDGRWLAYMSDESGRYEVYVEPFRRKGDRVRVSVDGGGQPKWRGDGRELFYVTPSRRLMAVGVQAAGDRLDVGAPTELFELRGLTDLALDDYAPTADGQRFLVKLPVQEQGKAKLHVVTNWPSLVESPAR